MAARSRNVVPYRVLHNLSSVDILFDEKKKRKRVKTVGIFQAERLVAQTRQGGKYYVKVIVTVVTRHSSAFIYKSWIMIY